MNLFPKYIVCICIGFLTSSQKEGQPSLKSSYIQFSLTLTEPKMDCLLRLQVEYVLAKLHIHWTSATLRK
jgi:hypothetical protein